MTVPFESKSLTVPVWAVFIAVVGIAAIGCAIWLYFLDDPKWVSIVSGILTGLILFPLGLLTQVFTFQALRRYEQMGIRGLRDNRHDKAYYRPLVDRATREVLVTGASATRFVDDFLDPDADDKALYDALVRQQDLVVRILVPDDQHMSPEAAARWQAKQSKIEQLAKKFPKRFLVKRFADHARHSFVVVDGEFVGGPIFEGDKSRHAPAVHVAAGTTFARKYLDYFEQVWLGA